MSNQRWLVSTGKGAVAGANGSLAELLQELQGRSDVTIDYISGPPEQPRRLVISASEEVIDELRSRHGERFLFAPDQPLQLTKTEPGPDRQA